MPLKTLEAIPQVILSSCPQTMSFVRCVKDQFDRVAIKAYSLSGHTIRKSVHPSSARQVTTAFHLSV